MRKQPTARPAASLLCQLGPEELHVSVPDVVHQLVGDGQLDVAVFLVQQLGPPFKVLCFCNRPGKRKKRIEKRKLKGRNRKRDTKDYLLL